MAAAAAEQALTLAAPAGPAPAWGEATVARVAHPWIPWGPTAVLPHYPVVVVAEAVGRMGPSLPASFLLATQ